MNAADIAYWADRAGQGDPAVDDENNCLGCGIPCWRVADGAASGCPVCLAFLDWASGVLAEEKP